MWPHRRNGSARAPSLPGRRSAWLVVGLVLSLSGSAAADADSLNDYLGPREIAVGESLRGAASGALAITLNPAGLALDRQLVFEGTYGYRSTDGASTVGVSACDSTVPVPGCFFYRYFGADPTMAGTDVHHRAHEFGTTMARALGPLILVGATVRYFDYNTEVAGEDDRSGGATDLGLTVRPSQAISVGVAGYNLVAADSPHYPRGMGGGVAIRPSALLGLSFDALWNLERDDGRGKGRFGGGGELFVRAADGQSGYPVRLGGVYDAFTEAGYLSGGIGFSNVKMALDVSARQQLSGGDDLAILAGLRLFGPTSE